MGVELQEVTCYNVYKAERTLLIACKEALEQIELTRYAEAFENEGITNILKYGIACYKKRCRVLVQKIYKRDLFYILYRKRARENFHTLFFTMIKIQLHIVQVKQEAYQVEIP